MSEQSQQNSKSGFFRIKVENRDQEYLCQEGFNLLVGMERAQGHSISVGCRGGGCGVCKILILDGEYQSKRMSKAHISDEEREQGFALACRVIPEGDMTIESDHFETVVGAYATASKVC